MQDVNQSIELSIKHVRIIDKPQKNKSEAQSNNKSKNHKVNTNKANKNKSNNKDLDYWPDDWSED